MSKEIMDNNEPVFLMRTASFSQAHSIDAHAHREVWAAADQMLPLVRKVGVTIATGTSFRLDETARSLERAFDDKGVEANVHEDDNIARIIESGRFNHLREIPEIRQAVAMLRRDREMGRGVLGGLVIVTSEYPIEAARSLQVDDHIYAAANPIEPGGVVLMEDGIL